MDIYVISDIHTEFHKDAGASLLAETGEGRVVVAAGDLTQHDQISGVLGVLCDLHEHVIYVNGNHECYGSSIQQVRDTVRNLNEKLWNLHYLDNSCTTINGQRFIGCTLWFPDHPLNDLYAGALNDFRWIKGFRAEVYEENQKSMDFLNNNVDPDDVVVTHHAPSYQSVSEEWKTSPLNRFFICNMEGLIWNAQPSVWIHGHVHRLFDYFAGETRVVCNPFGYPGEIPHWQEKIISV